jgi:3-methyladenine DNA glycosylase AlkD
MKKAVGWMLREAGKRDVSQLRTFLNDYKNVMPRTMLRYAIEKFSVEERRGFMKR